MNRTSINVIRSIGLVTILTLLSLTLAAPAAVISVNFIQNPGNDNQQIDADETFGVAGHATVVGGWFNVNGPVNNLADSAGNPTTVSLSSVLQPNGQGTFNANYADTPLFAGFDDYTATASACSFTLANMSTNFPQGYKVIVYVGGFLGCTGASVSDGTTTYYYRPYQTAPTIPVVFSQITQTTDLGAGNNPIAQYAVFGESTPLTQDTLTITIDTLSGAGSGLGGVQIIGATAGELASRVWRGNLSSNWDTATLNWNNVFFGTTNYAEGDPVVFNSEAVAANPTVNLTAPRSPGGVVVDGAKNYTFTGSGIAGSTGITKRGSGSLTLSNPNTYAGDTIITAGTLKIGASGSIPDGAGAGDVAVASGATLDLNGNSEGINGLSGSGTVENTGSTGTLTVGLNGNGGTFTGTLQGVLGFTKQGTNTYVLTGISSHTGVTIVGQGALVLNPVSAFSGSSPLVVSNGANLSLNYTNGSGLFSFAPINLNGGTGLTVDYGDASMTALGTPITTSGALHLNGVTQIGIRGQNFSPGTFTILSYALKSGTGSISSTPAFLPTGMVATIQDTGSSINLVVTVPSIQDLLWTQGDGEWSTNGVLNWNFGVATYNEYPGGFGDMVRFDNSNFGTVTLPHDVRPFAVTVAGNYVLTGPGRIAGATGLTRSGFPATTFILDNTNSYTGQTIISAGTLQINRPGTLGSTTAGTVVNAGGSLSLSNGITLAGEPLTLNGNGVSANNGALRSVDTNTPITVASPITLGSTARIRAADGGELILTGPITDSGSNYTLFLHAGQSNTVVQMNSSSNLAGNVTVYGVNASRGLIRFGVDNVFPASSLSAGGGLFDLNGTDQIFAGLLAGFDPALGIVTNSSAAPSTLIINFSGTNSAQFQSTLAGSLNVVKQGSGVQSFGGGAAIKHTYTGTTTVNEGILGISSDFSGVTNSFIVNSGGTLRGSGNTIGGPVTVHPGGTFYAGFASNAIGSLTISNNLSLSGNMIVALNKDVAPSNDVVNVTGALTYGGNLTVYNLGTNALVVGDAFRVFPSGGSGTFSSITGDSGAAFSFNDGELTVTSVGTVNPTSLSYSNVSPGVLQFSWTGAFRLQQQTNALSVGLSTNWVDYPDSSNPVLVTNNPAIPSSFFRLRSL